MKTRFIRNMIKNTSYYLVFFAQLIIIFAGFNVFFSEKYNPTNELKTFVILNSIALCLYLIRWIIKPEYKPQLFNTDFGTKCHDCYKEINCCKCHDYDDNDD